MGRWFRLCILITGVIFVGNIAVLSAVRLTYSDPFEPYAAIMPGQSIDAVTEYGCPLHAGTNQGMEVGFCHFEAGDGVFGRVMVVDADHTIARLAFKVQPKALRLGDVILCWGKPIYSFYGVPVTETSLNLLWEEQIAASVSPAADAPRPDYFLPITYLSLGREAPLCGSVE